MNNVIKTNSIGFCYGVKRAVDFLKEKNCHVFCFGEIVHNNDVLKKLSNDGIFFTENLELIKNNVVIRAHGVACGILIYLKNKCYVSDMTCPNVKKIHNIADQSENIIIFGDCFHPEVIGIVGHCKGESIVISPDLQKINKLCIDPLKKYTLVSQTTASVNAFSALISILKQFDNITVINTICKSTELRQLEVSKLSEKCDYFVVVGGLKSSNTNKLFEIASHKCEAFHIENKNQLPDKLLCGNKKIGLSSGTSTSDLTIEEVFNLMINEKTIVDANENSDSQEFLQAMEGSIKLVRRGYHVTGIISGINGTEVQVDIGSKHSGLLPLSEFSEDEMPQIGNEVEAIVTKVDDIEGTAYLSKKDIDSKRNIEKIKNAYNNNETISAKISDIVKGGIIANFAGSRVFIPASQTLVKDTELNSLKGQEVSLKIIAFDEEKHKYVGSIKKVELEKKKIESEKLWNSIEVGQVYTGKVSSICRFGAFVDIPGGTGLVHLTELSWIYRGKVTGIVNVGDEVKVFVKNLDFENKKISFSMKFPQEDPWLTFINQYAENDIIDCKVERFTQYGAFVSIIPGVDGLIHISQISKTRVDNIAKVLQIGQIVSAKIISIDSDKKKVSLSIKALISDEPETVEEVITEEN